jgi:iron complex transport system substrate-binding protein
VIGHLLLGWVWLLALPASAAPVRLIDDAGQAHTFATPPLRIVSLTPHLTELLFAVGAGSQVIGVDSASDYPEAARALPRVGDYSRLRMERILALKPDLIVAWVGGNRAADLHGVSQLGIPVLRTEAVRLDDVARLLRLLGRVTGHDATGVRAASAYRARLASLREQYVRASPLPVFYQVWDRPLMTVGGQHWISEALSVCGARNIFADQAGAAPVVSREAVLRRMPEVIASGTDAHGTRDQWQRFATLPAVKREAFIQVDADSLHRATPRLLDGVKALCVALTPYER